MVYHPNIDLEGNVCLNILREDWKPVLTINSIIYGLQYLFLVSKAMGLGDTKGLGGHQGVRGQWGGLWGQLVALGSFLGMPTPRWHLVALGTCCGLDRWEYLGLGGCWDSLGC
uniref:UBC core domain-containing protein n=1 Tax=Chrysolophus pictus TaxID=9089 RepID=A0A8C3LX54_CHRPC